MDRFKDRRGSRKRGMAILLSSPKGHFGDFDPVSARFVEFNEHPFKLPIPNSDELAREKVCFIGAYGSDESVRALAACIRFFAADRYDGPTRLRIINIRPLDDMAERRFLFEVEFGNQTFIGGDCTYYSGNGGAATVEMRGIFLALSTIYDLDIEEEVILENEVRKIPLPVLDSMGIGYIQRQGMKRYGD